MAEKKETPFLGGFDVLEEAIHGANIPEDGRQEISGSGIKTEVTTIKSGNDNLIKDERTITSEPGVKSVDPDFFKMPEPTPDPEEEEEEVEEEDTEDTELEEDIEEDIEKDIEKDIEESDDKDKSAPKDDSALDDIKILEEDVTAIFKEKFAEELGWDFSKMEDEPKDIAGIIEFMKQAVAEASVPEYANEEVKNYDEFVRNGGNLRTFYKNVMQDRIDPSTIDIEEEVDQKRIIRQNLKNQGINDSIIEKRIKRYDEAGVLLEEAEEALQMVQDYDEKNSTKLLEQQQKHARDIEEQQQKFVGDVQENINKLSDIKGIKITEKDKKELRDYILVADADGLTQYQRDYLSDVNNLLESAYFTKNKDVLIDRAKKQGASDSLKNLQKKLNQNKGNRSKSSGSRGGDSSLSIGDLGSKLGV